MKWIVVALCLSVASVAKAQSPTWELKGEHFGDTHKQPGRFAGVFCEKDKTVPGAELCVSLKGGEIAGAQLLSGKSYLNGQLFSISYSFPASSYVAVGTALRAKYGEPSAYQQDTIQNRMGAKFLNEKAEWKFADGVMYLEKYGSDLNTSMISANDSTRTLEYSRLSDVASKAAALRDLGPPSKR